MFLNQRNRYTDSTDIFHMITQNTQISFKYIRIHILQTLLTHDVLTQVLPGNPANVGDLIPVDIVANHCIVAAYKIRGKQPLSRTMLKLLSCPVLVSRPSLSRFVISFACAKD